MLRVTGGASGAVKRPRGAPIVDFSAKLDDLPAVKSALSAAIPSLGELMASIHADDIYQYIIEQKNGERIISRICAAIPEYEQAKDHCLVKNKNIVCSFLYLL